MGYRSDFKNALAHALSDLVTALCLFLGGLYLILMFCAGPTRMLTQTNVTRTRGRGASSTFQTFIDKYYARFSGGEFMSVLLGQADELRTAEDRPWTLGRYKRKKKQNVNAILLLRYFVQI